MSQSPEELHQFSDQTGSIDPRIADLFDEASELAPAARRAFLDINCKYDPAVRAEVERLLKHHDRLGMLDSTLLRRDDDVSLSSEVAILQSGKVLADRFRIVRLIGCGGMGQVYEAQDLQTGLPAALKTIRAEAADIKLTSRFRRELRIARDIVHSNVCKVDDYWDIEQEGERFVFFTMDLLQGETLSERIRSRGPMKPRDALRILRQVASGLEEVHRRGIVHRDLKPSNIFLVAEPDGGERPVIMDFGLARAVGPSKYTQTTTKSIMGTPMYMAPELFEGEPATVAADVYSFGVTAFEMITGANYPLVAPRSVMPTLAPEWDTLQRCFSRRPEMRPASVKEVIHGLEGNRRKWIRLAIGAAAVVGITLAGLVAWNRFNAPPSQARTTAQITFDKGFTAYPSTSGDGKLLVYSSDRGHAAGDLNIWLQSADGGEPRQLTFDPGDEISPAISPDGSLLAYLAKRTNSLMLKPLNGGVERAIAKGGDDPRFSPDGKTLVYWVGEAGERSGGEIWTVALPGREPRRILAEFVDARFPAWAPDGRSILFRGSRTGDSTPYSVLEWWIYNVESGRVKATGADARLKAAGVSPHDSPSLWVGSQVLFAARSGHSTNLWSLPLSSLLGRTWGNPAPFTNGAGLQDLPARLPDGRIAYANWRERIHIWRINCRTGELTELTSQDSLDTRVSASRDGGIIAFGRRLGDMRNVWVKNLTTGAETQLAENQLAYPLASPSGRLVAYSVGHSVRLVDLSSSMEPRVVCEDCGDLLGWLPDESGLSYLGNSDADPQKVIAIDLKTKQRRVLLDAKGLRQASISPDGGTIAYSVALTARDLQILIAKRDWNGVYGAPVPVTPTSGKSHKPVWSDDGRTLYYDSDRDGFECIWSQAIDPKSLMPGEPKPLKHFHQATFSLSNMTTTAQSLAQAGGMVFLSVDSAESNIWAVKP